MLNISTTKSYRRRDVTLSYSHPSIHFGIYSFLLTYHLFFFLNLCRRYVYKFERGTIHVRPHQSSAVLSSSLRSTLIYLSIIIAGSYGIYCQVIRLIIRAYPNGFGRQLLPSKNSFLSISRKRTKKFKFIQIKEKTQKLNCKKRWTISQVSRAMGLVYFMSIPARWSN